MKEKIKEITIREVTNGYIVRVGCSELVFKQGELIEELTEYIMKPLETEMRYIKEYGIRDDLQPIDPARYTALNHPGETQEGSRSGPIRND